MDNRPANANGTEPAPIDYSTVQYISSNDYSTVIAEKAAKVLPRSNQAAWMRLERDFLHPLLARILSGVSNGVLGAKDPSVFNPTELDADQMGPRHQRVWR